MDPNACFDLMFDAILLEQYADAFEHARNLWNWLVSGGFKPSRTVPQSMYDMVCALPVKEAPGLRWLLMGIRCRLTEVQA